MKETIDFGPAASTRGSAAENIANALTHQGWGAFHDLVPMALCQALLSEAITTEAYSRAGVGRRKHHQLNRFVRSDRTAWIEGQTPTEDAWLDWAEALRIALNRSLFLGLEEFESHFAHYAPGAFYRKHFDAFKGSSNRILSLVLYLNSSWTPVDGGQLKLFDECDRELAIIPPTMGTLAVFFSERFPHEVLPTNADRYSIAGWFRLREELPAT